MYSAWRIPRADACKPFFRQLPSKNYRRRHGHKAADGAHAMGATRAEKTVPALWQSWEAKGQARHSAPLFFSPVRHRKNGEGENVSCLRRAIASTSPRPARPWTSSRWRLPTTCVYLYHLKNCRENVIKIYLNRRIKPQKRCTVCSAHGASLFLPPSPPSSSYQQITPPRWR